MTLQEAEECVQRAQRKIRAVMGAPDAPAVNLSPQQAALAFAGTDVPAEPTIRMVQAGAHGKLEILFMDAAETGESIDIHAMVVGIAVETLLIGVELGREAERQAAAFDVGEEPARPRRRRRWPLRGNRAG